MINQNPFCVLGISHTTFERRRSFIRFYYKFSPGWVKSLEHNKMINKSIKKALNAFIKIYKF